jgi:hypothetical protein
MASFSEDPKQRHLNNRNLTLELTKKEHPQTSNDKAHPAINGNLENAPGTLFSGT